MGSVRDMVIRNLHETLVHPGPRPLAALIGERYFIPRAVDVIEEFSRSCHKCLRSKHMTTARGFADAHDFPQSRWHTVAMDFATGLPRAGDGAGGAVLVVVDAMTKRVVLAPSTETANADDLIRIFRDEVCYRVGFPQRIRCDKGSTFTSRKFQHFCGSHDMICDFATTDHHVADVERVIRTLREKIRAVSFDDERAWFTELARIEFAINRVPAKADGLCPFQRDMGYAPRLPGLDNDPEASIAPGDAVERSVWSLPALVDGRMEGKERSAAAYDKGRVASAITVGSKVCVKSFLMKGAADQAGHNRHAKTRPVFSEVLTVLEDCGRGNWRVSKPTGAGNRVSPVFHESVLKPAGEDAVVGDGLREEEMQSKVWPDGSQRLAQVLGARTHYRKQQVLVRPMGENGSFWTHPGAFPNDKAMIEAYLRDTLSGGTAGKPG